MTQWLKRVSARMHRWEYRNPYDRTCSTCGRHEVEHCRVWSGPSWWEVFHPGRRSAPCNRQPTQKEAT